MADIFDLFKKISSSSPDKGAKPEYIVAGLGNPGAEYARTRHNAGFLALDRVAAAAAVDVKQSKFKSLVGVANIGGHSVLLMKPQTYMNLSGEAVGEAASFYKIPPERVIVICDDICQAVGRMRVRRSGSAGGQRGLLDIIKHLGTESFPRIRLGVGEKPSPDYDLKAWVLGKFSDDDMKLLSARLDDTYECLGLMLDGKLDDAMGRFNGKR